MTDHPGAGLTLGPASKVPPQTFLGRRGGLLVGVFILIAAAVATGVLLRPPRYEGTMKFLVRKAKADTPVASQRSPTVSSGDVSESEMNSEIELLNARDLLEELANRTLLHGATQPVSNQQRENAVSKIDRNLDFAPVPRANIISVTYSAESPDLAVDVLRQLSALYLEKRVAAHRTPSAYAFLEGQAEHYEQELRHAQEQFSSFRGDPGAVSIDNQKDVLLRRTSDVQRQTKEVNAAIRDVTSRIARLADVTDSMSPTALSQPGTNAGQYSAERLSGLIADMNSRRTELLQTLPPKDRAVKEIEQRIADTTAALNAVRLGPATQRSAALNPVREALAADLSKTRQQLNALVARRAKLAGEEADLWNQTRRLDTASPQYAALTLELKAAEANFQLYQTKAEEARIAEALEREKLTNVTVAQVPIASHVPVGPSRTMLLLVGWCLAGLVSIGTALGADYARRARNAPPQRQPAAAVKNPGARLPSPPAHLAEPRDGPPKLAVLGEQRGPESNRVWVLNSDRLQ